MSTYMRISIDVGAREFELNEDKHRPESADGGRIRSGSGRFRSDFDRVSADFDRSRPEFGIRASARLLCGLVVVLALDVWATDVGGGALWR